jgi:hypothetical protein
MNKFNVVLNFIKNSKTFFCVYKEVEKKRKKNKIKGKTNQKERRFSLCRS